MRNAIRHILSVLLIVSVGVVNAQSVELRLLDKINSQQSLPSDPAWRLVSKTVTPFNIVAPITMYTIGSIKHDPVLKRKAYQAGISLVVSSTISTVLKVTIERERPFAAHPDLILQKAPVGPHSFPSGHTSNAFSLATTLSLNFPKWYVIVPAYSYAAAVGYSRLHLGVHYPGDVLGGVVIGTGSAFLGHRLQRWLDKSQRAPVIQE